MSVEFVDTNVLVYAHDRLAVLKREKSIELLIRLVERGEGALSTQVLVEFYAAATKKLNISSEQAEEILRDLGTWSIHRPTHADLLRASRLQRRYRIGWWDALIVTSAIEIGASTLWTEDLNANPRYETVTVRNPFE